MEPGKWERIILLLIFLFSSASGAFVGVNIGKEISRLPPAEDIISILKTRQIYHVRLFDADHRILKALANSGVEVMIGVQNEQLLRIGQSQSEASDWINKNVAAFVPATNITYISVGNEVLTSNDPNASAALVPAMRFLHSALVAAHLNDQIKVSSPQSMNIITRSFPPSIATFDASKISMMYQYLQFLKETESSFLLNAQPYYAYRNGQGIFPIEYALLKLDKTSDQIVDPNTNNRYSNMLHEMVDAAYYSMRSLNFSGIPVIVTASGWPTKGGANEPEADVDNALAYNTNLIRLVLNGTGTPSQPAMPISVYIHELFDEDLQQGPDSNKNWGMLSPNGTALYTLEFGQSKFYDGPTNLIGVFCVANAHANPSALQEGLDWACGPGSANCTAIQPGQPCYDAGNIVALASYAYNDYYHKRVSSGGSCNFHGTALISNIDPSHGSCIFAGSADSSLNTSFGGTHSSPPSPGKSSAAKIAWRIRPLILTLLLTVIPLLM